MKVGIFYLNKQLKEKQIVENLTSILKERKIEYKIFTEFDTVCDIDVLIVLGGDGSILKAGVECGKQNIKIIGVNFGRVGFLTEFDSNELLECVELLEKDYQVLSRSVLQIEVDGKPFYAINEVSVHRIFSEQGFSQIMKFKPIIDGRCLDSYFADGFMVSTPTGSTAYSLSAGGAILTPTLDVFMFNSICAHKLLSRPIVYSNESVMTLDLSNEEKSLAVCCDGKQVAVIDKNSKIEIKKAPFSIDFIKKDKQDFFDKLIDKLNKL